MHTQKMTADNAQKNSISLNFNEVLSRPEYDFLRQDPHLGKHILFLNLSGSHGYGTSIEGSDIDVRGVMATPKDVLLGFSSFEQVRNQETDTTIYTLNKFMHLACACNPGVIEILGGLPESYAWVSDSGKMILENRNLFLSRRAAFAFREFANSQMQLLQEASLNARNQMVPPQNSIEACNAAMDMLEERYHVPHGLITLSSVKHKTIPGKEIILMHPADGLLAFAECGVQLESVRGYLGELSSTIKNYNTTGKRTKHFDADDNIKKMNKYAMHIVRIYLTAIDILKDGQIVTYRGKDREQLLEIRNGKYVNADGTIRPEFFDLVNGLKEKLASAEVKTALPKQPDMKKIEELLITLNTKLLT